MLMKCFVKSVIFIAGLAIAAVSADIITDVVAQKRDRYHYKFN